MFFTIFQHTVARVAESADKDGITVVALYSWGSGALGQLGTGQHRRANLYPNRIDEALDDRKSSNSGKLYVCMLFLKINIDVG